MFSYIFMTNVLIFLDMVELLNMNPYSVYTILAVCLVFINKHVEFWMFLWESSLILFLDVEFLLLEKINAMNRDSIFISSVMTEFRILFLSEGCKLRVLRHHTTLI